MLSSESVGLPMKARPACRSRFLLDRLRFIPRASLETAEMLCAFQGFQRQLWGERLAAPEGRCFKSGSKKKERIIMKNNNQINVPQAREAMDKFKMQAASEGRQPDQRLQRSLDLP